MKIIADDKIPYLKGALEPFAEVVYLPGAETCPEIVRDVDALITRTRTICDERLLKGSSVKYIASATIGADHIDTEYCRKQGIAWSNAPGCNAGGVCQYVAAALFAYAQKNRLKLRDLTIGIVGVGHVGEKVAALCHAIGMKVLINDPPRQRAEGEGIFTGLDRIQKNADIISFHVPLNSAGEFATRHMVEDGFLKGLGRIPSLSIHAEERSLIPGRSRRPSIPELSRELSSTVGKVNRRSIWNCLKKRISAHPILPAILKTARQTAR